MHQIYFSTTVYASAWVRFERVACEYVTINVNEMQYGCGRVGLCNVDNKIAILMDVDGDYVSAICIQQLRSWKVIVI